MSSYATFSRASLAFYEMINDRAASPAARLNSSASTILSPPKTVEQTRKLVEGDQVFAIVAPMGGTTAKAVQKYLNDKGVPQFLIQSRCPTGTIRKTFHGRFPACRTPTWKSRSMRNTSEDAAERARRYPSTRTTISAAPISRP